MTKHQTKLEKCRMERKPRPRPLPLMTTTATTSSIDPFWFQSNPFLPSTASATAPVIEITVLSAQGLRNTSSFPFFLKRLKPFATVSLSVAAPRGIAVVDQRPPAYSTRTDDRGGTEPWWNEKFQIPVDLGFLADVRCSSICVRVYARGRSQLGWCRVPVEDAMMSPPGKLSYLSYRLRDPRDGTRGHGIVNVAVKLDGLLETAGCSGLTSLDMGPAVLGIPVSLPLSTVKFDLRCHRHNTIR